MSLREGRKEGIVTVKLLAVAVVSFATTAGCSDNGTAGPGGTRQPTEDAAGDAPRPGPPEPMPDASTMEGASTADDASGADDASSPDVSRDGPGDTGVISDASSHPDVTPIDGAVGGCRFAFCESFESQAVGAPPDPAIWTRTGPDLVVDGTRAAHGGRRSLHVPPLTQGSHYIRENTTIAKLGTSFYGRVFFWIDKQPVEIPATLYHWTLLEADELDSVNTGDVLRLGGHIEADGTNWLRFNFETHGNPGETGLSDKNAVLTTGRWYCAEFYYSLPDNEARFWLDGVEDPTLHWKGPMGGYTFPTKLSWMSFGWAEYQVSTTPWDVWIDEIALDKNQVGCD